MRPTRISFLSFINNTYGTSAAENIKAWMKCSKSCTMAKQQLTFLIKCRKFDLFPKHLDHCISKSFTFHSNKCNTKFYRIINNFKRKLLKTEIEDINIHIKFCLRSLRLLELKIKSCIPFSVHLKFFNSQQKLLDSIKNNETKRLFHKFEVLSKKELTCISSEVNDYNTSSVSDTCDKWILNLSGIDVPDEVLQLLKFGDKFSIQTPHIKKNDVIDTLKELENNIHLVPKDLQEKTRNKIIGLLNSSMNQKKHVTQSVHNSNNSLREVANFIKDSDILPTRADKGNTTVLLNRSQYVNDIEIILKDPQTYETIKSNPGNGLKNRANACLRRWKLKEYITNGTFLYLNPSSNLIPRAYGLPKIHKIGNPYRIIVSSLGSPLHRISRFIHNILYHHLPKGTSFIKNSYELVDFLHGLKIPSGFKFISLDVVSLFTNVPKERVIEGIQNRWMYIQDHTKIPLDDFINTVSFILDSTYFSFNKIFYKQLFGSPMGSPLSPVVADIVMQDLELEALSILKDLNIHPLFYYRYVDDIVLCVPDCHIQCVLDTFNTIDSHLKFTLEVESNNTINFLDISLINNNGYLLHNWYYKPTFSGRFINFKSNHPIAQRKGVAISLIDRVIKLSDVPFIEENLTIATNILLSNSFPITLINQLIISRLKILTISNNVNADDNSDNNLEKNKIDLSKLMVIPYLNNVSEKIASILKEFNIKVVYKPVNKLNKIIKTGKDKIDDSASQNVVYQISCNNCNKTYVGQTKRDLKTRINEHMKNIHTPNLNVISNHRIDFEHNFNWDKVKILDIEPNYKKRLLSEMFHITSQDDTLNIKSDTKNLHKSYELIMNNIKKFK